MNELLDLRPHQWNLIVVPPQKRKLLLGSVAHIARRVPVMVFDCGRQFDATVVARAASGRGEVIDRIRIQRAFTCYEAVKLLEQAAGEKTPILILDFLSTFYDENVKKDTRIFLLETSLRHFQRLGRGAGLAVTAQPPAASSASFGLFQHLQSSAPQTSIFEPPNSESLQLDLF